MSNEWYVIPNLSKFIDHARMLVFNSFGAKGLDDGDISKELDFLVNNIKEEDKEELDKVLSHEESLIITHNFIKKQKNRKTKTVRYLVDDKIFMQIITSLNDRMISNMLNNLVNKGLLETGFDSESNDFVFWIPEKKEKPETD